VGSFSNVDDGGEQVAFSPVAGASVEGKSKSLSSTIAVTIK